MTIPPRSGLVLVPKSEIGPRKNLYKNHGKVRVLIYSYKHAIERPNHLATINEISFNSLKTDIPDGTFIVYKLGKNDLEEIKGVVEVSSYFIWVM